MSGEDDDLTAGEDDAVLQYLAALDTRRAAPPTLRPDEEASRLAAEVEGDDQDLERLLAEGTPGSTDFLRRLEPAFVECAARYAARHRISYEAWLQAGVEPSLLARAGIHPPQP